MRQYLARQLQQGLSLIELLVTMTIAVILLAVGVPSFIEFTTSNTASSYANDLLGDLNYARSEAITRGCEVVVCKGTTTTVGSVCTNGDWRDGWKVFVDCDKDQTVDALDEVLRVHASLANGWTLRGNNNVVNRVSFQPTGLTNNFGTLVICRNEEMNVDRSKAVVINKTGRSRIASDTDNNGTPDSSTGAEITSCTPTGTTN